MVNFSVVVITKNEEKTLPRLLKSLDKFKERGGEVCILDTGSTDKTVEVAKKWGCKVKEVGTKFITVIDEELAKKINDKFGADGKDIVKVGDKSFHFANARNEAASMASNNMIAMPDADEIYTALDIDKVEKYVARNDQLEFNFVFSHDEKGRPLIKFIQCKMYDRTKMHWTGRIHEVVTPLTKDIKKEILPENIYKIEHYQNHTTSRTQYLIGLAIDCFENPKKDRNSHYFARELLYCGYYRSAIKEFERHISMKAWEAERNQSMIYIGDCLMKLGEQEEAFQWYQKAYLFFPYRRAPLLRMGEHFFNKGEWNKAIFYLEGALKIGHSGFYSDNMIDHRDKPHWMLYVAYWWSRDKERSKYHYQKAVEFDPNNPKYINDKQFYIDKYSVIIPTMWASAKIKDMIEVYDKSDYISEIIIIDNNPKGKLQLKSSKIKEVTKGKNIFVNPAWNWGVSLAKEENIIIANDDIFFNNLNDLLKVIKLKDKMIIGVDSQCFDRTEGPIRIEYAGEKRQLGFGTLMITKKSSYKTIPNYLKIWCGDDIQFEENVPFVIKGLKIETKMSETINKYKFNDTITKDFYKHKEKKVIKPKIRILLTNHHLYQLGGSELWTYTMAKELDKRGFEVGVFTHHKGVVTDMLGDLVDDCPVNYDLALINHNTCIDVDAKFKIYTAHGTFPSLEVPPPGADVYVAVNENTAAKHNIKNIIKNPIDTDLFKPKSDINDSPERILAITDVKIPSIKAVYPNRKEYNMPELMNNSDVVISIGRGALEAMSCARNVIVWDNRHYLVDRGDGYMDDPSRIRGNTAGPYSRKDIDIKEELKKYKKDQGMKNRDYILKNHDVRIIVDKYLSLWGGCL